MADIYLERVGNVAVPADDASAEIFARWKPGDLILCKTTKPRKGWMHRKYFKLLDTLWSGGADERFDNREAMRAWLQCKAGHYDMLNKVEQDGKITFVIRPKSISWSQMSDDEFDVLYMKVFEFGLAELLPSTWDEERLHLHIDRLLEFDHGH